MVDLTKKEKQELCEEMARHLPRLRELLHLTQVQLGERCGMSCDRISAIENGHFVMKWSQLTSILLVCLLNRTTKEYLIANKLLQPKMMQFFQRKEEDNPPDVAVSVSPMLISSYEEMSYRYIISNQRF